MKISSIRKAWSAFRLRQARFFALVPASDLDLSFEFLFAGSCRCNPVFLVRTVQKTKDLFRVYGVEIIKPPLPIEFQTIICIVF